MAVAGNTSEPADTAAPEASGAPEAGTPARRPRGRQEVREALLEAAQRLIAEQGPANVRLREIADAAGVNFGLVYQYLGTREDLLHEVYQRVAVRSATRFEHIEALADVVDIFLTIADGSIGRIMGWAALEGGYSVDGVFGHSPAQDQVAGIISREARQHDHEVPDEEARVFAAFLQVVALGWRLFRPIGLATAGVDPAAVDADALVTKWLHLLSDAVVRGDPATHTAPPA
ncbi:helix-turn-helix transcriptional regulator [Frankia sp. CNm7]|uniref:Helix-turn-helix transcriptional regulator n=1 Tax=Frankia nepalensis TaxID=1836974 RepID=A0A937UPJ7_9ACTN|nr:helix-turn-helix domain-containing protein [Frankia nepalensis]MBL7496385.1 helix-turn-helix transcriptional regulator [Frankia nepalensis]MBL7511465.1 helix-turn-helix transcriptional regulator [Frankia nepalensis]MBL7523871.1 helix-turn-helix transcriptional regulator [Frankia nepalensis]MBL7627330.1 helix-turn-helix transcriptional regulator [Frankia nepalensis]